MADGNIRAHPASRVLGDLVRAGDSPLMTSFPQGAVFAFDSDLRYLAAGGLGLAEVGLSREALEGRTIHEVFPQETVAAIEGPYRAALRGESTTKDVRYEGRVYLQRLAPVLDETGTPVAGLGFTQDVTEVRRAEQALRESELRLRLTTQNAPIGEAIVELDGRWRTVNPALINLIGYSEDQLLAMTFQDITHPDDLNLDLDLLAQLVAGEVPSYQMEKRYFTAAGSIVWVLLSVSLVRDPEGEPLYFISQIQDITDLKRQQDALRNLTAMLAHDLRTPTTVISGYAQTMLEGWEDFTDAERHEAFSRVASAARTMGELLENSLTTASLDARGLHPTPKRVNLDDAVREALESTPHAGVSCDLTALTPVEVWIDPTHLLQILGNLVTNSVKYGGDQIAVATQQHLDRTQVTFSDNGPGVPAEFVDQLFDRFSRSDTARAGRQRGSGLGLFIVRDLLRLNGADIAYSPTSGGGARFALDLPAPPAEV